MQVSTDWVGLIDEWAQRFFHELDYDREARSAILFKQQMEHLEGITVAPVYSELTSGEVLTTAWVQGESIDLCSPVLSNGEHMHHLRHLANVACAHSHSYILQVTLADHS